MNLTRELIDIVERAHSLDRILEAVTKVIAARFQLTDCVVFLMNAKGALERSDGARAKSAIELREASVVDDLADRVAKRLHVEQLRSGRESLLAAPLLLRAHSLGVIVLRAAFAREFSALEGAELEAIATQLTGVVENARIIDALDRGEPPPPFVELGASPTIAETEPPAADELAMLRALDPDRRFLG